MEKPFFIFEWQTRFFVKQPQEAHSGLVQLWSNKILDNYYMTIHIHADVAYFLEISRTLYGLLPI
jgi:hypothetical protein